MDADKAVAMGVEKDRVIVTGNLKFDIEPPDWNPIVRDALLKRFNMTADDKILVAGSTHIGEEEIILDAFKRLKQEFSDLKLVLAPRHPERFDEVEKLILAEGLSVVKRSQQTAVNSKDVILLDTIGELCNFYSISTVAFVGGTLVDIGGHNLLEPAFYKKPVVYGPHLKSYREMAEMLEARGGGIRVGGRDELFERIRELLSDKVLRQAAGNAAHSVIEANKGATEKSLKVLEGLMVE
jgi:3-deoxy-D-manno-octulosonic-acid transferase